MNVYTYQIAKWRKVRQKHIFPLDTTIKSGEELLAPTWNMVMGHKAGAITDEQYEDAYMDILSERYAAFPDYFEWLTELDKVALGCYCPAGKFCHRHILVKFLKEITEVNYLGEIE
ncbi:hypothetical protein [Pseudomonas phage vB_PaeM_PS119XW]|uniref:DUF488 domain-containing protein n=1 Tax=Pseudomonas phage vB_PaeM_PS119XW TaxID=2601632 RepID=A0A5C1K7N2_9CAUD|nr:hypothetical protein PP933_gp176 [Pseudomonas phage vB_PaeM_PS119XW]QEM41905.1 hypothetical protein [Pseudomonas phage vB_PaeM_PS119XW]BEG72421.1 hypothetical protein RVBP21_0490 [Pseudomonas phage BRkr]